MKFLPGPGTPNGTLCANHLRSGFFSLADNDGFGCLVREPNQQGFQRSRAMGGETHFFHPSTDTKQEIAVMCESTCPVVMADAHL